MNKRQKVLTLVALAVFFAISWQQQWLRQSNLLGYPTFVLLVTDESSGRETLYGLGEQLVECFMLLVFYTGLFFVLKDKRG
jgi:hypothetical protein